MNNDNFNNDDNNNVSIFKLLIVLWSNKISIILITLFFVVISIFYSLSLPEKYKSETLMIPIEQSTPTSAVSGLGGLASLAGVSIKDETSSAAVALQILKSRKFTRDFINSRDILVQLMASEGWDRNSDSLIYDKDVYDTEKDKWVRKVSLPKLPKPNDQEAYKYWNENVFTVSEDRKTGWVTLSIEFYSPKIAQQWVDWLVDDLNNYMRNDTVTRAESAIEYLNNEIAKTSSVELQNLFYALIRDNTEKKMLAFTDDDFIFKIIDPPVSPYLKSYPQRSIIVISFAIFGLFIAVLYTLFRNFYNLKKD